MKLFIIYSVDDNGWRYQDFIIAPDHTAATVMYFKHLDGFPPPPEVVVYEMPDPSTFRKACYIEPEDLISNRMTTND